MENSLLIMKIYPLCKILLCCAVLVLMFQQTNCASSSRPTELDYRDVYSTSIVMTWKLQEGFSYVIRAELANTEFNNCEGGDLIGKVNQHEVTHTSDKTRLKANMEYDIAVCSINAENQASRPTKLLAALLGPAPPDITSSKFIEPTELSISWYDPCSSGCDDSRTANFYTVFFDSNEKSKSKRVDAGSKSTTLDKLVYNTAYNISVMITSYEQGVHRVHSDNSTSLRQATVHSPPTSLEAQVTSESRVNLTWNKPDAGGNANEIESYLVTWSSHQNDNSTLVNDNAPVVFAQVNGLISNSKYVITVLAMASDDAKGVPATANATTLVEKPLILAINSTAAVCTHIYWKKSSAGGMFATLTGYRIIWISSINNASQKVGNTITDAEIKQLISNTIYTFTMHATTKLNINGTSSDAVKITTLFDKPTELTVEFSAESSIELKWVAPEVGGSASSIQNFAIRVVPGNMTFTTGDTRTEISPLIASTNYNISVMAVGSNGKLGIASDILNATTVPSSPNLVDPCNVEDNGSSICVMWTRPTGGNSLNSYELQWNKQNDLEDAAVLETLLHDPDHEVFSHKIYGLLPGQKVDVSVKAQNSAGSGKAVSSVYATVPSKPSNIDFVSTSTTITFQWKAPKGFADAVIINSSDDLFQPVEVSSDEMSSTITNLSPNTSYRFIVYTLVSTTFGLLESEKYSNETKTDVELRNTPTAVEIGLIVGIALGSTAGIILIIIGIYFCLRRNQSKEKQANAHRISALTSTERSVTFANPEFSGDLHKTEPQEESNNTQITHIHQTTTVTFDNPEFSGDLHETEPQGESSNTHVHQTRRINLSVFHEAFERMTAENNDDLKTEFKNLTSAGSEYTTDIGGSSANTQKNRYKNILPYDNNRVILEVSDENLSDYINASYVDGFNRPNEYIASQGPRPETTNDFWRMIWEQNCENVVMLTQLVEKGKIKCELYWPVDSGPINLGGVTIQLISEINRGYWIVREFEARMGSTVRRIRQFHYMEWPDHGVPETGLSLVRFASFVRLTIDREMNCNAPTLVHCSAGVGRTGTFLTVDYLLQHLKHHQYVDIYGIVYNLRKQRPRMVQTDKQYVFLYQLVSELLNYNSDLTDDDDAILYANISVYQHYQPRSNQDYESILTTTNQAIDG